MFEKLSPYLGNIDALTSMGHDGKAEYVHPALRQLGAVSVVLVREIVAPAVFRNLEAEMTEISFGGMSFVRAVPNKFKFKERGRGLQLLRHFKAGGDYAQNRHVIPERKGSGKDALPFPPSEAFDMNAVVFGDSVNQGSRVLPIKASILYSDGLSLCDYGEAVGKTFHNRASEDGSLFNAATKQNSSNLFERHYVLPGTLFVQVLTTTGRTLPMEGFRHLMLSLGEGNAYGGQTSVTGVNVRNHLVGIYASRSERPETSPYVLASQVQGRDLEKVCGALHGLLAPAHEVCVGRQEAEEGRSALLRQLNGADPALEASYSEAHRKVGAMFDAWFTGK